MKITLVSFFVLMSIAIYNQAYCQSLFRIDTIFLPIESNNALYIAKSDVYSLYHQNNNKQYIFSDISSNNYDSCFNTIRKVGLLLSIGEEKWDITDKNIYYKKGVAKEKNILSFNLKYKGHKYYGIGLDYKNPCESFKVKYDALRRSVIIPVYQFQPNISKSEILSKNLFNESTYNYFMVNSKGKIISAFGSYDSIFKKKMPVYASPCNFDIDTKYRKLFLTHKSSSWVKIYNLDNGNLIHKQKLHVKTDSFEQKYINDTHDLSDGFDEQIMKTLIENESIGDIVYSSYLKKIFVLRVGGVKDTTWIAVDTSLFSIVNNDGKKGNQCYSGQFFKQMLMYYLNKPVYIQVYNENFEFLGEQQIPVPNETQFIHTFDNIIYLSSAISTIEKKSHIFKLTFLN